MYTAIPRILFFVHFLILSQPLQADFVMQLGKDGDIGITTINAIAGTTLSLDVYLTQRGFAAPGVGEYRLSSGSNERGLGSFYFDVGVSNAADGAAQTGVRHAAISQFNYGSSFSDQTDENGYLDAVGGTVVSGPTSATRFVGFTQVNPMDLSKVMPAYVTESYQLTGDANTGEVLANSLLLGTLLFDIAPDALGSYQLDLSAPGGFFRSSLGHDPFEGHFDAQFVGGTIHVTAVPEPTSLVLVASAFGIGLARYRMKVASAAKKRGKDAGGAVNV